MFLTSRFTTQMNVFMHMMVCMRYCAHDFSTVPVPVHAEGTCVHVYPTPPPQPGKNLSVSVQQGSCFAFQLK